MRNLLNKKLILIVPAVIILGLISYRLIEKIPDLFSDENQGKKFRKNKKIETILPVKKQYTKTLSYFGNLEPVAKVDVYSKQESRIIKLYSDVAEWVSVNQILVQLDDKELIERKNQKEANYQVEKANLNRDKILLNNKKLIYDRAVQAYRDKIIPEQDLDNARTDYEASLAQVNLSKAKLSEARASIEEINTTLSEMKLYSPLDGVISERYLDTGSLVKANQPIFKILAIYEMKLIISIPENDINKLIDEKAHIKKDIIVDVYIEALNRTFIGTIYKIYPTVDTSTRTIKVEVRLENKHRLLKPGFYCRTNFNIGKSKLVLILPTSAIKSDDDTNQEWVQIMKNDIIITKKVRTIPFEAEDKIILEGINENDKIINPFNPLLVKKDPKKMP